ncbi:catechol 2,3-dioxygenase [Raineyella antarctica]|uniref:Catechol 2,3-dioxygenase n=1 Tax=Raineyella antarctica TaxID=1577474 RepID=A0A1G6GI59_9ACTN|nr:VOC family protein [Raineyella antarctica]SDB81634.1 catechol 2,3-dioxygenase [Raineyella antarctica]
MALTGVTRLGYVHAKVTDMADAKQHYCENLGLLPTTEEDGKLYLKGWDEWDHHSVLLEEGGVGVTKIGFKVNKVEDLDTIEKKAQAYGDVPTERMSAGENAEVSDGLRFRFGGHTIELYHDMTEVGVEVGVINPDSFPQEIKGIGAPILDHALLALDDVDGIERFFMEVLDFYPSERMVADHSEGAPVIATWLSAGNKTHDIAFLKGPDAKLHHFSFYLKDWGAVTAAADLLVHRDVPLDLVPTRHGITRGETTYFFDPSGNRNETFSGAYVMYPDRPCVTWTMDQLGKGLDYYRREVTDTFLTVFS